MRRVHLRGRTNILKRLVVHTGAANLGLLMRKMFGVGTPRALQGRVRAVFSSLTAIRRVLRPQCRPSRTEDGWFLQRFLTQALMACLPAAA